MPVASVMRSPKAKRIRGSHKAEVTAPQLLALAVRLHRDGNLDEAERCYRALLELDPRNANALHFLGVLLWRRDNATGALELIQQAIAIDPMVAAWHNNLGNVLLAQGHYDQAAVAYGRCTELDPDNLEVLNNLGLLLQKLGRPREAEATLLRAIAANPRFAGAHTNLAMLYVAEDRLEDAFSQFAVLFKLLDGDTFSLRLLAYALARAQRFEEAKETCRRWLGFAPGDVHAMHMLAALGGADVPERAPDDYVVSEFDGFAKSFDAKLAALGYRAPELVRDALERAMGQPQGRSHMLDLGCGTGLCGVYLRPYASVLVGVDLSPNMLELARQRGIYDTLVQNELVAFLQVCEPTQDAIVAADTLCYFGRLDAVFAAVHRSLRAGGHWVFTLEAHAESADFHLHPHGRYSHGRGYLDRALTGAGFGQADVHEVVLRQESGAPVSGWLVSAAK